MTAVAMLFIVLGIIGGYIIGRMDLRKEKAEVKRIKKISDVILNVSLSQFDHQQKMIRHNMREMIKEFVPKDKQKEAIKDMEEAAPPFSKKYFIELMEKKYHIQIRPDKHPFEK